MGRGGSITSGSAHEHAELAEKMRSKNERAPRRGSYNFAHQTSATIKPPFFVPKVCPDEDGKIVMLSLRERVYICLDEPTSCIFAKHFSIMIMILIVISSIAFVLETVLNERPLGCVVQLCGLNANGTAEDPGCIEQLCAPVPIPFFDYIEYLCITAFTTEYVGRLLTVHAQRPPPPEIRVDVMGNTEIIEPKRKSGPRKTFEWILETMNLIDLVAILPFYLTLVVGDQGSGLAVLRILRLARIFRIFKIGKYNDGMQMFARVITNSAPAMYLLAFFFALGTILFGSIIFFCESGTWWPVEKLVAYESDTTLRIRTFCATCNDMAMRYPEGVNLRQDLEGTRLEPTPFPTIIHAFWWVATTTTTVGYGDTFPTTTAGKIVGVSTMLSGILVLALPITIIGANFANEYSKSELSKIDKEEGNTPEAAVEEITPPVHKSAVVVPVDSGKTQDGGAKMHYDRKRRTTVITQANAEQSNPFDVLKKKPGVKRNTLAGKTGGHSFDRLVDMAEDESVATQDVLLAMDIDALSPKECQTLLGLLQLKALARNSRRGSAGSAGSVSAVSEGEEEDSGGPPI